MTEPRGFYATWSVIFGMTALPFGVLMTVVWGLVMDLNMGTLAITMGSGLFLGAMMGLVLAPIMKGIRTAVPVQDKAKFAVRLRLVMAELNYKPGPQALDHFIFEPLSGGVMKIGPVSLSPPGVFSSAPTRSSPSPHPAAAGVPACRFPCRPLPRLQAIIIR